MEAMKLLEALAWKCDDEAYGYPEFREMFEGLRVGGVNAGEVLREKDRVKVSSIGPLQMPENCTDTDST
jgi:hypothetical protein